MLHDRIIFGALSGIIANLVMEVLEIIMWKFKIIPHPLFQHAGSLFMPLDAVYNTGLGGAIGFIACTVYSALLGVVFIYILTFTGKRFSEVMGLIYGAGIWFVSYGGLCSLPIVKLSSAQRKPLGILLYFFLHLLHGFVLGKFARRFRHRPKND